jgi:hypothetical protein
MAAGGCAANAGNVKSMSAMTAMNRIVPSLRGAEFEPDGWAFSRASQGEVMAQAWRPETARL